MLHLLMTENTTLNFAHSWTKLILTADSCEAVSHARIFDWHCFFKEASVESDK